MVVSVIAKGPGMVPNQLHNTQNDRGANGGLLSDDQSVGHPSRDCFA